MAGELAPVWAPVSARAALVLAQAQGLGPKRRALAPGARRVGPEPGPVPAPDRRRKRARHGHNSCSARTVAPPRRQRTRPGTAWYSWDRSGSSPVIPDPLDHAPAFRCPDRPIARHVPPMQSARRSPVQDQVSLAVIGGCGKALQAGRDAAGWTCQSCPGPPIHAMVHAGSVVQLRRHTPPGSGPERMYRSRMDHQELLVIREALDLGVRVASPHLAGYGRRDLPRWHEIMA